MHRTTRRIAGEPWYYPHPHHDAAMRSAVLAVLALLAACTPAPRQFSPDGERPPLAWSAEDLAKPIAVRPLGATAESSRAAIRLATAEKPHTHNEHDLVALVTSGTVRMHLGDQVFEMRPGDVVEIPRGVVHWAQPLDGVAEAYVIFTPPYDGTDHHPVE